MVELDIKINASDLYDFMLMHSYNQVSGLLGSILGALMIVVSLNTKNWLLLIGGILLLLYLPWVLFVKSRQQVLANPVFKETLHYVLDERGVTISQGEAVTTQSWDTMVKAVSTNKSIILYTSKVNATIFPKSQMGDKKSSVIELISTHMPPAKVKIRS